jgi:3-hydroxyisobutyrate dehydrogenase
MSAKRKIGFIGLGNIGKPMAKHLIKDIFDVYVYDVFEKPRQELAKLGATAVNNPREMFQVCDHVGLCVRDGKDVESLLYGADGILENCQPGTVIAIHSTVQRSEILKWNAEGKVKNIIIIDAPITGGASGAEKGTLCYMVGADAATLEKCRPVLETSADKIIHAGEVGIGIVLKLCNNLITYAQFTAVAEASKLAKSCGLSESVLREVGKSNGVINEQMHTFISGRNGCLPTCTAEQMEQIFGPFAKLGEKDLDCALAAAKEAGLKLPATELVRTLISDVYLGKL